MEAIVSKFLSILNHSKIMYSVFFFGIWNCVKERNRILALPNTTNCFKYLRFSAFILQFKADRLQMIVVAKNLSVLQLFIGRMPKMCAILQLVSAPLNPIPIAEHFRKSYNRNEITDYFVCTANAHAWVSCILC